MLGYVVVELIGDRYSPRTIISTAIAPNPVAPGAIASIIYTAKDERQCGGVVHRWIIDSARIVYDLQDDQAFYHGLDLGDSPSTEYQFVREFQVPLGITPGQAVYHSQALRWCNLFQEFLWPMIDNKIDKFVIK